jgi:hypothetical protein
MHPIVALSQQVYQKGVTLSTRAMQVVEARLQPPPRSYPTGIFCSARLTMYDLGSSFEEIAVVQVYCLQWHSTEVVSTGSKPMGPSAIAVTILLVHAPFPSRAIF